jgi:hypothetical protein
VQLTSLVPVRSRQDRSFHTLRIDKAKV